MRRLAALAAALALCALATPAQAQFSEAAPAAPHFTAPQAAAFGKTVERDLAARGVRIALVFRTGRPRKDLPPGIRYTHGALWVYRDIQTSDGRALHGYAVYSLFQGDGVREPRNRSHLSQDWPTDFVLGSVVDDVAVIVPTPEMQRRLLALVDSPAYEALHNPSYTLVANPLTPRHQNCDTFMLDLVAAAAWETRNPRQIRADLVAHFRPSVVRVDPFTRLFAPMFDARVALDDQHGPILTATYESIAAFMRQNHLLSAAYVLRAPLAEAVHRG